MGCEKAEYPELRWLDSVYIQVMRSGKQCTRCFTDLTEQEQRAYLEALDAEGVKELCSLMANTVRGIGDLFQLKFEGVEE